MLVKRRMSDGQLRRDLLRTPLNAQQIASFFAYPRHNYWSFATSFRPLSSKFAGLLGAITLCTAVTGKLTTNAGLMSLKHLGSLGLVVSDLHEGVNLISFGIAEVFVVHEQLRLAGQEP